MAGDVLTSHQKCLFYCHLTLSWKWVQRPPGKNIQWFHLNKVKTVKTLAQTRRCHLLFVCVKAEWSHDCISWFSLDPGDVHGQPAKCTRNLHCRHSFWRFGVTYFNWTYLLFSYQLIIFSACKPWSRSARLRVPRPTSLPRSCLSVWERVACGLSGSQPSPKWNGFELWTFDPDGVSTLSSCGPGWSIIKN